MRENGRDDELRESLHRGGAARGGQCAHRMDTSTAGNGSGAEAYRDREVYNSGNSRRERETSHGGGTFRIKEAYHGVEASHDKEPSSGDKASGARASSVKRLAKQRIEQDSLKNPFQTIPYDKSSMFSATNPKKPENPQKRRTRDIFEYDEASTFFASSQRHATEGSAYSQSIRN